MRIMIYELRKKALIIRYQGANALLKFKFIKKGLIQIINCEPIIFVQYLVEPSLSLNYFHWILQKNCFVFLFNLKGLRFGGMDSMFWINWKHFLHLEVTNQKTPDKQNIFRTNEVLYKKKQQQRRFYWNRTHSYCIVIPWCDQENCMYTTLL